MDETKLNDRKAMLTALFEDKAYVPMKAKELAVLLNVPKSQRCELQEVLDLLVAEGKAGVSKKGKYGKPEMFSIQGIFSRPSQRLWFCYSRRKGAGRVYPGG